MPSLSARLNARWPVVDRPKLRELSQSAVTRPSTTASVSVDPAGPQDAGVLARAAGPSIEVDHQALVDTLIDRLGTQMPRRPATISAP